ncbi:MAG: cupin domain-containing protein [Woeseia sp.]
MTPDTQPARAANEVSPLTGSSYPEPFRSAVAKRAKRALGQLFGLDAFGVNLVELPPGACSSQRHWHTHEDEFVYVLDGEITLITDRGETVMKSGDCAGFKAGVANGHQLRNNSEAMARYMEVGSRHSNDEVFYPDIDLELRRTDKGHREFRHRDGAPW